MGVTTLTTNMWKRTFRAGLRSPEGAVGLVLNSLGRFGQLVGDGPGVAGHGGRGGVDLVDQQRQGAGDAGSAGPAEAVYFQFLDLRHRAEIYNLTGRVAECPLDEMSRPRATVEP
jgi:hypothetical protein